MKFEYLLGDTLEVLKTDSVEDENFSCIYLDPPFNSDRNYKYENTSEEEEFTDKWEVGEYENRLNKLIPLLKKKLKKDGNLFFHISAEQSLIPHKVLTQYFPVVEPVFWKRAHGKNTVKKKFGAVIDIIYRAHNGKGKFNLQYVPLDEKYFQNSYTQQDEVGLYALGSLKHDKTRRGQMYKYVHDGVTYEMPYGWKVSKEKLEELISQNRIHFSKAGTLYKKLYRHENKGKPLSNLRDDISYITRTTQDKRLYPTQKPVALLERIIDVSSDEGDWILDPVGGSGTTGVAAINKNRNCVLIDINPNAKDIGIKRINDCIEDRKEQMGLFGCD